MRQKLIEKGETDDSTIITGDFNTPLSVTDRSSRQKIIKDEAEVNNTINQYFDVVGWRILHPTIKDTFSSARGTFSKTDHNLDYKISVNKFKGI